MVKGRKDSHYGKNLSPPCRARGRRLMVPTKSPRSPPNTRIARIGMYPRNFPSTHYRTRYLNPTSCRPAHIRYCKAKHTPNNQPSSARVSAECSTRGELPALSKTLILGIDYRICASALNGRKMGRREGVEGKKKKANSAASWLVWLGARVSACTASGMYQSASGGLYAGRVLAHYLLAPVRRWVFFGGI